MRQTSGGATALVDYDPAGMLRRVTVGSAITEYLYDGPDLVLQYNGSGAIVRRFVHGPGMDEPLVVYEGSGTTNKSWLHADERGSIIAASNASGAAASSVKYNADGDSGALAAPFGYTGQLYLPELQLYYYKARVYSAKAGRFLQPDPIGYAGGINLYAYAANDPVNLSDPSGLEPPECSSVSEGCVDVTAASHCAGNIHCVSADLWRLFFSDNAAANQSGGSADGGNGGGGTGGAAPSSGLMDPCEGVPAVVVATNLGGVFFGCRVSSELWPCLTGVIWRSIRTGIGGWA